MERSICFLGTQAAHPSKGNHTSFILNLDNFKMLVDVMGGYSIVKTLESRKEDILSFDAIFLTHADLDHTLGFSWIIRMLWREKVRNKKSPKNKKISIICSKNLKRKVLGVMELMNPARLKVAVEFMDFIEVKDQKRVSIKDVTITPIDLKQDRQEQFAFVLTKGNFKVSFTGDEPMRSYHENLMQDSNILIHEAFCLAKDEKKFKANVKNHSTSLEAAQNAARVNAKVLILDHIAEEGPRRKERFTREVEKVFSGKIFVPDDGDIIKL